MIELNGKKLALNDKEFSGSCVGYYKVNKRSISILDANKQKVGVINARGVLGSATKVDGGYWYSYADIDIIGRYESYMKSVEEPTNIIKQLIKCERLNNNKLTGGFNHGKNQMDRAGQ